MPVTQQPNATTAQQATVIAGRAVTIDFGEEEGSFDSPVFNRHSGSQAVAFSLSEASFAVACNCPPE